MTWLNAWWSQVSGTATHGLQITVIGMLLVFFTLGLIIVSLILLTKLPGLRVKEEQEKEPTVTAVAAEPAVAAVATPATTFTTDDDELAQVAAIAVAVLRGRRQARARTKAQATGSTWKSYGRAHQLGL